MIESLNSVADDWALQMWRAVWQGSVATGIVYAMCRICTRIPGQLRCWLWRAVFLRMLILLLIQRTIDLPVLSPPPHSETLSTSTTSSENSSVTSEGEHIPSINTSATAAGKEASGQNSAISANSCILVVWMVGIISAAIFVMRSAFLVSRLCSRATPLTDSALMTITWNCAERFRLSHIPRVLKSPEIHSPAVAGLMRPVILIPDCTLPESPEQLRMILAHEMAHIRRRDLIWNWLDLIVASAFFFNPLIWLALRELRFARESACDEMAVEKSSSTAREYANALLEVVRGSGSLSRSMVFSVGVVESASTLTRRLLEMRYFGKRSELFIRSALMLFVIVAIPAIMPWKLVARAAEPVEPSADPAVTVSEPSASEPSALPAPSAALEPDDEDDNGGESLKSTKFKSFEEAWSVGVAFYNAGNHEAAQAPLEAALKMAKDDEAKVQVYEALIATYRRSDKTDKMTQAVEFVLYNHKSDIHKSLTRRSYLSFLYQRGKIDEAVKRYEKKLKQSPDDLVSLYLLSEIYSDIERNPERATEILERLQKLDPVSKDDPEAANKQAKIASQFMRAKDYKKAAEIYESIAPLDKKLAGYYLKEAAIAHQKLGNTDKAIEFARLAVEAGPDTRNEQLTYFWSRQLGDLFLELELPGEAIPLLKEALTKTTIEGYLKDTQANLDIAERKVKK